MRGLLPYAWRSLRARPARTGLTIAGIAVGVGVLVAGLAVETGISASIDRTVAAVAGQADLRITGFAEAGLSRTTVDAITATPGVAVAAPAIERRTAIAPSPERPAVVEPVTVLGVDPSLEGRVHAQALIAGSPLLAADEPSALVGERLARSDGLDVGMDLALVGADGLVRVRVIGILAGDGQVQAPDGRTLIVPIGTAARLAGGAAVQALRSGATDAESAVPATGITRVDIVLAKGAERSAVMSALNMSLVTEPYVLSIPGDLATSLNASTEDLRATTGLLAAIALFAGAFLIVNTLSMTVTERARELALLRAAGASRDQLARIVGAQAAVLAVAGSFLGLVLGVVLATLLADALRRSGGVPLDAPIFEPGLLLGTFLLGVAVTLAAAAEPARRASSVSPVEALRARARSATVGRTRRGWLIAILAVVAIVGAMAFPAGPPLGAGRALLVDALLIAAVLLAPALLVPLGRAAGAPFARFLRLEERLARAAIVRDRSRSGLTVGALVVGLTMVVALGAVAANARLVATAWIRDVVPGDEVLTAVAPVPLDDLSPKPDLEAVDGVASVSPIATFDLAFRGQRVRAAAMSGADLASAGRLTFLAGDRTAALSALDAGGAVILPRAAADRLGVGLADVLRIPAVDGTLVELSVVGIVERSLPSDGGEAALVGWSDATSRFGVAGADAFAIRFAPGAGDAARAAVATIAQERALTASPVERIEASVTSALDRLFGLFDLLALAAIFVAALGIVNTLSMDVWERVRELGVLRAAGMSRRQVWRMMLVEAGILGVIGAVVGSVAGLGVGWLLVVTAGGRVDVPITAPWASIALAFVLGVGLSILAASQPARLASRLSIVRAVRAE